MLDLGIPWSVEERWVPASEVKPPSPPIGTQSIPRPFAVKQAISEAEVIHPGSVYLESVSVDAKDPRLGEADPGPKSLSIHPKSDGRQIKSLPGRVLQTRDCFSHHHKQAVK
jgi:hypothetical protein